MKKLHLFSLITGLLLCGTPVPSIAQEADDNSKAAKTANRDGAAPESSIRKTWVDDYEALLQKYVTPKGVRYQAWHQSKADIAALDKVIAVIAAAPLTKLDREEKLAFYLNAYNAWILHRILQDYPTDGPGGGGFFGRNKFFKSDDLKVAGSETSFSDLENEIIRPKFSEPRIHFALNCASRSCPPLHTLAFRKATLDATLTALATAFVNENPNGVKLVDGGKKVQLSKIFDWYENDFKGGQVAYINRFRNSKIPSEAKVEFQDYSWNLNEAR